jgi:AraC-like DNA-binding protein
VAGSSNIEIALVPVSYGARLVAMLEARGFTAEQVLAGSGLTRAQLDDPTARMSFAAASQLLGNAMELAQDASIGLELGLAFKASSHGWLGMALITCNSLRDAIMLGGRFIEVRGSPWRIDLLVEGDTAIMRFVEVTPFAPMRTLMLEAVLGGVIRLGEFMLGESFAQPAIEFWSDSAELPHHARFRDQVPHVRYNCPTVQAMFPASWLDRPLALREPIAHREAVSALENEWKMIGPGDDLLDRARALLSNPDHGFPGLEQVASRLSVSSRTLRRHLKSRGTMFYALRDEVRRARGVMLLEQSKLTINDIARALGYADGAGFVRAFQRWTGETPSSYRKRASM